MQKIFTFIANILLVITLAITLPACSSDEPTSSERYKSIDIIAQKIIDNLNKSPQLQLVEDIDHSKLAAKTDNHMPPARVIIFSNIELELRLLKENKLLGVDLPFKVLIYENASGTPKTIYNNFNYLTSRYGLEEKAELRKSHTQTYKRVLTGVEESQSQFNNDSMQPDGLITINSLYDFDKTVSLVYKAINSQDDTITFGEVDYQQRASDIGITIMPSKMILFGAPAPGAEAMRDAVTLGLDAFCQKFLVWKDTHGKVHLSYNDLLAIAERQGVDKSIPLRVINYRLEKTFKAALME